MTISFHIFSNLCTNHRTTLHGAAGRCGEQLHRFRELNFKSPVVQLVIEGGIQLKNTAKASDTLLNNMAGLNERERCKDKVRLLDRNQLVPAHLVHGMQHSEMREREHLTYLMFTIEPWKYTASLQHWSNSNDTGYIRN